MSLQFRDTYLYKLHSVTTAVDRLFDHTLREYAGIRLSQFLLLLAVGQHPSGNQRQMATFLGFSRAAIKRQVGVALQHGWIEAKEDPVNRRQHMLSLTPSGQSMLEAGLASLKEHAYKVFAQENRQTGLMQHLDLVLENVKEVKQEEFTTTSSTKDQEDK